MLAAVYRSTGSSEVLSVEEVPTPAPGPGEVRVRLRVAGVNPTDWKMRTNAAPAGDFQVPGQDGAGDIDAVGDGVDRGRVGERVWVWFAAARGRTWGTAAQWTVVPARQAVRLPDGVSYDVGAGLGIPAMTAWHCLFGVAPQSGAGQGGAGQGGAGQALRDLDVLVAGGAGAVGNAAIALARRGGARVTATASTPEKMQLARDAGAGNVVDYRSADAAQQIRAVAPRGVVRIVELALGANVDLDVAVAAPHAVIATYADDKLAMSTRPLMVGNLMLSFVMIYGVDDADLDAAVSGVSEALAAGALPALPHIRYPLADVGVAHDAVQSGVFGKVLLDLPAGD